MVENPLICQWTVKKLRSTVIFTIWREVLFFSIVATSEFFPIVGVDTPPPRQYVVAHFIYLHLVVSLVSHLTPHKLSFPNVMLTVLGTVLGLVISFRTSSAYERSVYIPLYSLSVD